MTLGLEISWEKGWGRESRKLFCDSPQEFQAVSLLLFLEKENIFFKNKRVVVTR